MTYREEFPEFESEIPAVFLNHPWRDVSWHNDTCPSFCRQCLAEASPAAAGSSG
jgi:hypothetical protein